VSTNKTNPASDADKLDDESSDLDESVEPGNLPPMDFSLLVFSLNASALMQLGEAPSDAGPAEVNMPMARQTIDMIGLLEQKTRGNLTGAEEHLLNQVLFDLRMRYTNKIASRTATTKR
jgi:hypothetical protein